jgi:diaminohydroxyphosphoribosylaminopyrimidine deaminase/5-amino-6-(5-phosphoribosylamino)uracil reductase
MSEPAADLPSAFAHLLPRTTTDAAAGRSSSDDASVGFSDATHLSRAIALAERGIGRTHPNPPVGAVIVDESGQVLGEGFHRRAGLAHGEVEAILDAQQRGRVDMRGCTMFVTLEPCAHHGRTPPCADRLVDEGFTRVVIGARDPNARVDGKGIDRLQRAGVDVTIAEGALAARARALIAPFTMTMRARRPYVVVKVASSLDGRVATASGHARWITGEASRALVHRLRASVDAILVGSGTARTDDPALTARDVGRDVLQPRRIVVDGALAVAATAQLFSRRDDDRAPPLVLHTDGAPPERAAALDALGVERIAFSGSHVPLASAFSELATRGLTSVLVEAGPGLMGALLAGGLIDELWWMSAPLVLGGDARPASAPLGHARVDDAPRFTPVHAPVALGDDVLSVLRPRAR